MAVFRTFLPIAGMDFNILVLVAIGFTVGVLGSFFGVGGGWIATPALNVFGFPISFAIGTGLASIAGQSTVASIKHRRMGNVDYVLGVVTGAFMVAGVEGGAQVVMRLESLGVADSVVRFIYIALLTSLGGYMAYEYRCAMRKRSLQEDSVRSGLVTRFDRLKIPPMIGLRSCGVEVSVWVLAAMGLLVGFLAGLMGAGGGFALVPAFVYLIGIPTALAVGTSLLCVMISGAYGAFSYGLKGSLEVTAALWMLLGAAVGAQLGAAAVRYVRGYSIRLLYSSMLLMAAAGVLLKQLGLSSFASVVVLGGALAMCVVIVGRMAAAIIAERRDARSTR